MTLAKTTLNLDVRSAGAMLLKAIRRMAGKWITKGVVTLDIDSTTIRLLETKGGTVTKWASVSLEPDEVEGETVSDQPALGTMVRELMTSSGIKARKVVVSISGLYSVSRILAVSSLPPELTLQEAVLEMARETMPLSEDRLYLSWQTIVAGEGERQVLVLGVPRDVIDGGMRALRGVGINPRIVELKTMALTRAVNKEQALILNIEPSSFDIIMVLNGLPEIMRTIAWQPDDLTEEDKVEHLAVTLGLTVDFYNSRHPDTPLDPATPLFITGQMSGDITLMEKLQAELRYPVEPLAPPLEYPEYLPISEYAVNIGLALRGTVAAENLGQGDYLPLDINLLPEIYYPWRPSAKQLYAAGLVIAAIALLFPLYQATAEAMGKTARTEAIFTSLNNELEGRKLEIKDREPLQKAIGEYRTIVDMGGGFTGDLEVIQSEAGKLGVRVESISHGVESITLICQADSYITFREYLTALEESGRFTTPIPPPEGYPYTTGGTIELEPAAASEEAEEDKS